MPPSRQDGGGFSEQVGVRRRHVETPYPLGIRNNSGYGSERSRDFANSVKPRRFESAGGSYVRTLHLFYTHVVIVTDSGQRGTLG